MENNFVCTVRKCRKIFNRVEDLLTIGITVLLVVVVFLQVVFRYFFNSPLAWSEELARYVFIWLVYISAAVVLRDDSHMSMDFFVTRMSEKFRVFVDIMTKILISIFMIICIVQSITLIRITLPQISPSLSIPMGLIYLALPVSFVLMLLDFLSRIILKKREGDK